MPPSQDNNTPIPQADPNNPANTPDQTVGSQPTMPSQDSSAQDPQSDGSAGQGVSMPPAPGENNPPAPIPPTPETEGESNENPTGL